MKLKKDLIILGCMLSLLLTVAFAYHTGYENGKDSIWDDEDWTTIKFNSDSKIYTISDMKDGEQTDVILVDELITHTTWCGWLFVNQTSGLIEFREIWKEEES